MLAQNLQIVAVIEFVLFHCGTILTRIMRLRNLLGESGLEEANLEMANLSGTYLGGAYLRKACSLRRISAVEIP